MMLSCFEPEADTQLFLEFRLQHLLAVMSASIHADLSMTELNLLGKK